MNEENKFLDELKEEKPNLFDQPIVEAPTESKDPEEVPESVKNRQHKRLEQRLQQEREANIAMAARLEAIAEANRASEEPKEYLKSIERIYGTDTPEAVAATELLKNALKGVREDARDEALSLLRDEQVKSEQAVEREVESLDSIEEEIEDTYGVDFSANPELRRGFFSRLERLSPKDAEGYIIEYADPIAVWEDFSSRNQARNTRAKDISARSVGNSVSQESNLQANVHEKFLRDNNII